MALRGDRVRDGNRLCEKQRRRRVLTKVFVRTSPATPRWFPLVEVYNNNNNNNISEWSTNLVEIVCSCCWSRLPLWLGIYRKCTSNRVITCVIATLNAPVNCGPTSIVGAPSRRHASPDATMWSNGGCVAVNQHSLEDHWQQRDNTNRIDVRMESEITFEFDIFSVPVDGKQWKMETDLETEFNNLFIKLSSLLNHVG